MNTTSTHPALDGEPLFSDTNTDAKPLTPGQQLVRDIQTDFGFLAPGKQPLEPIVPRLPKSEHEGPPLIPEDTEVVVAPSAQKREGAAKDQPCAWYKDEAGAWDAFVVINTSSQSSERVYFCSPPEPLCEAIEEMPLEMAEILGVEVEELTSADGLQKHIKAAGYKAQLSAKRYLSGLYQRIRVEPDVIKDWSFLGANGQVREITPATIEALPPDIKQMISQSIVNYVLSGEKEQSFTRA